MSEKQKFMMSYDPFALRSFLIDNGSLLTSLKNSLNLLMDAPEFGSVSAILGMDYPSKDLQSSLKIIANYFYKNDLNFYNKLNNLVVLSAQYNSISKLLGDLDKFIKSKI